MYRAKVTLFTFSDDSWISKHNESVYSTPLCPNTEYTHCLRYWDNLVCSTHFHFLQCAICFYYYIGGLYLRPLTPLKSLPPSNSMTREEFTPHKNDCIQPPWYYNNTFALLGHRNCVSYLAVTPFTIHYSDTLHNYIWSKTFPCNTLGTSHLKSCHGILMDYLSEQSERTLCQLSSDIYNYIIFSRSSRFMCTFFLVYPGNSIENNT